MNQKEGRYGHVLFGTKSGRTIVSGRGPLRDLNTAAQQYDRVINNETPNQDLAYSWDPVTIEGYVTHDKVTLRGDNDTTFWVHKKKEDKEPTSDETPVITAADTRAQTKAKENAQAFQTAAALTPKKTTGFQNEQGFDISPGIALANATVDAYEGKPKKDSSGGYKLNLKGSKAAPPLGSAGNTGIFTKNYDPQLAANSFFNNRAQHLKSYLSPTNKDGSLRA